MEFYALTDVGKIRIRNQDYIYSSSNSVGNLDNLFLVADGMGGHKAGDYASRYMVENLIDFVNRRDRTGTVRILKDGIETVNRDLYRQSLENANLSGMGTTLVAATVEEDILYVANVGDSRLYLLQNGQLRQITKDHSLVEELVAMGQLDRNSADYALQKNIITRALGVSEQVVIDFFEVQLLPGDLILLCSDGLTNMVSDDEIQAILMANGSLKEKVECLIKTANDHGGRDNIAVIVAEPQISEVKPC